MFVLKELKKVVAETLKKNEANLTLYMMNKFENLKSIAQNVTVKTVHLDSGVPFLYEVYPET